MITISDRENIRIDIYLTDITDYSRATINKMIQSDNVLVNDLPIKPSYKIKLNDKIYYNESFIEPITFKSEDIDLDIIYEDEYIIIINKPSGMVVHPGNGNTSHTLVNALLNHTNNLSDISGETRPGIVHRIDKDTSGILLIAKNNKVHQILSDDFKNKRIKREYIALLDGVFKGNKATIDAPIGRDKLDRKKMCVTSDNSKKAVSHLQVLNKYSNNTLVSFILETGRTHQIRVHALYIGYPVHNDPVYNKSTSSFGQFLHSYKITFTHPITKKTLSFTCPLPREFQKYIDNLE